MIKKFIFTVLGLALALGLLAEVWTLLSDLSTK